MNKDVLIKISICLIISLIISISFLNISFFDFKSDEFKDTEEFLNKDNSKDINEIKEEIENNNEPIEPVIPEDPEESLEPKKAFQKYKILMIGDSFVEGMEAYEVLYSSNVIWERGKRIDNMNDQLDKAITFNPNILILVYGSNDVQMWDSNVDGFINAYEKSLDEISNSLPNTKIYVTSILPVNDVALKEDPSFKYINLFNNRLKQLCDEKGIDFLDSSYILDLESNPYSSDGIHPKGFFYEKWALDILDKIEVVR